jgi:uncharacterized membrane protein YfcA
MEDRIDMPNRREHQTKSAIVGAAAALYCARNGDPPNLIIEGLGGAVGGYVSGTWADELDPPWSPNHRGFGHAVLPTALVSSIYLNDLEKWQLWLRNQASKHGLQAATAEWPWAQLWQQVLEAFCRFLAGVIAGLLPGHWTHLLLDARTQMSLPVSCVPSRV